MRLFLGIELPEPLIAEIGRAQSLLRQSGADVRWVRPGSAHLTLAFLGEVDANHTRAIDGLLHPTVAPHSALRLAVVGLGAFPSEARARVIWAGIDGDAARLRALQQEIGERLADLGFARERRRFTPHVTIGRVRGSRATGALAQALRENRNLSLGPLTAGSVSLIRSHLSPAGTRYETLSRYELGPAS